MPLPRSFWPTKATLKCINNASRKCNNLSVGCWVKFPEHYSLFIHVLFLNLSRPTLKEFPRWRTPFWVLQRTQNDIWRTAGLPCLKYGQYSWVMYKKKTWKKNYLCKNSSKAKTTSVQKQQIPKTCGKMLHSVSEQKEKVWKVSKSCVRPKKLYQCGQTWWWFMMVCDFFTA